MTAYGRLKKALAGTLSVLLILTILPAGLMKVEAAEIDQTALYIDKGSITIGDGTVSGYDINGNSVTVPSLAGYIITQADSDTPTSNTVTVTGGSVDITLKNVNMQIALPRFSPLISVASGASVDLTLSGTNTLVNYNSNTGIQLPLGASLSISGTDQDTLNVTGGNESAAIGTSYYGISGTAGTLNISGGKVIATGYDNAAGIGGSNNSKGGNVNITGGTVTVHSGQYGAGIGGGNNADGGTVTITGGIVTTYGGSKSGAGIGGGYNGSGGSVTITGGTVNAYGGGDGAGIGGGTHGGAGSITVNGGTVTAIGGNIAYFDLGGAGIGGGNNGDGGSVNILNGTVTATGGGDSAGIGSGMSGAAGTVTIIGGTITATGGTNGAGIGGGAGVEGGRIDIGGGSVTVYGNYGSGIGGGAGCAGGTIEISSGSVTAQSSNGAGIGGGFNSSTGGGNVTITGGKINATGGINSAGIGGGGYNSACGTVIISGGWVMANGGSNGAGIGGGEGGSGGNISISGGTVMANGGAGGGAGIGAGNYSVTGNTVISGGSVHAGSISGTLTSDGSTPVYPTNITLPSGININALSVRQSVPYSYGFSGMQADGGGVLYLWLPTYAGNTTVSVTADGTAYSGYYGLVSNSGTILSPNVLKMDQSTLTININGSYEYGDTISPSTSGGNGSGAVTFNYAGSGSTNYSGNTAPLSLGDYVVTATKAADNSYNATSGSGSFSIVRKIMASSMISDITGSYTYNGSAFEPTVTVSNGSMPLIEGTDYNISYSDNIDAGTATVTVTGVGNYTATAAKHFTIDPKTGVTVNDITGSYTYTHSGIEPPVTVKDGSTTLAAGTDFTVAYSDNVEAGTATVTVTGRGNYTGTVTKHFTINPRSVFTVDDIIGSHIYTGSTIEPPVTVRDGSTTLVEGTDYNVSYSDNVNAGTATVTVTGRGNYTGTVLKTFTVMQKSVSLSLSTIQSSPKVGGTVNLIAIVLNAANLPGGTVTFKYGSTVIASGVQLSENNGQYTASAVWNNVPSGQYTLTAEYIPAANDNYSCFEAASIINFSITKYDQTGFGFSNHSIAKTFGDVPFTLSASGGESVGSITYSSSDASIASIDEISGLVTIKKPGTMTITATKASDSTYNEASDSINITVSSQRIDRGTGVIYDFSNATLPQGVTSVSVNSSAVTTSGSGGSMYSIVSGIIDNSSQNSVSGMNIYDLSLTDQVGNHVAGFTGTITVKIPIPNGMIGDLHVYWYNPANSTLIDMHATQQNGYLVFETTHFSYYAIAQLASHTKPNPKTGDNTPVIPLALLGASVASGLIIIKKRDKWKIIRK